jgi:hypothetical protein
MNLDKLKKLKAIIDPEGVAQDEAKTATSKMVKFLDQVRGEKGDVGPQGPKGDMPIKGKDYFTSQELDEFGRIILKKATPIRGVDYFDGRAGLDGKDGRSGKDGKDGKSGKDGKPGEDGKDGINPKSKEVIEEIKKLKGEEADSFGKAVGPMIEISQIKNASTFIFNKNKYKIEELMRGGAQVTVSDTAPTNPIVGTLWCDTS